MDATLILDSGKQKGRETRLALGVYLVGRSKACQIRPKNKLVSRKHCAIINRDGSLQVRDIGSKTGTYINGTRVEIGQPVELRDGDRLQVGRTRFRFAISQVTAADVPRPIENSRLDGEVQFSVGDAKQEVAHQQLAGSASSNASISEGSLSARQESGNDSGNDSSNIAVLEEERSERFDASDDDILKLLADDGDEPARSREFQLSASHAEAEVDLEEDSDSGVDLLAPASGEAVSADEEVPAYKLRQDWDVKSVQKWVANEKSSPKPATQPAPFQLNGSKAKKVADHKAKSLPSGPNAFAGLVNGDSMQLVGMIAGVALFLAWIAWNIWRLYSFQG